MSSITNKSLILAFVMAVACLFGQQSTTTQPKSNPFDIKDRVVQPNSSPLLDTDSSAQISTSDTSSLDSNKIDKNNPFEVNHVPIVKLKSVTVVNNPIEEISKAKPEVSKQFVFWIMIFSWALLAIVITTKTNLISYMVRSVTNINFMKMTKRDESNNSFLFVLLYFVFFINFSVFIYLLQRYYTKQEGIKIWFYCFLVSLAIYIVRYLSMWFLGKLFPVEKEASFHNYVILVFNIIFGITIIPINLILSYGPEEWTKPILFVGIGLFGIIYILRNLRGLTASLFLIGQGLLSFFIYLCVFEIAPILIMVRSILTLNGQ